MEKLHGDLIYGHIWKSKVKVRAKVTCRKANLDISVPQLRRWTIRLKQNRLKDKSAPDIDFLRIVFEDLAIFACSSIF